MSNLGEVLVTARRACGLTQEELAAAAGVTQAALSRYENDLREPEPEVLARLARALGVTETFLARAGRVHGGMAVDSHMRRRLTAKPTVWRQLEARLNMYRMHARLLFEEVSIRAEQRIPTLDPAEITPTDAARLVRMQWRMPLGPVRSLTQWLESAGCLVIEEDFGTTRVDGLSQWIGDHPVILINLRAPTDRKRLTLAHELGHLCLHSIDVSDNVEAEANEFAAEFLMPIEVIRPQLRNLKIGRLHDLKREWGVSMQAIVERSYSAGLIGANERSNMYKAFSARGWRIKEPLSDELTPEHPALNFNIGDALLRKGLGPNDVAQLAGFATPEDNILFPVARPRLRPVG
ncbi:XRE family transcriptional regulator [Planomonospora sphaerica]|uniref:XRE family transcriptional regulator n=1 Tax=Planomonospora sphaerica TaxID=161355 RepID=A0A171D975_9ACTN|nr:XRE family transcriptional regulator [Planomonospora sphaerica]GAT67832.1 XRE family transcriptional regulator [Planomonospora sphaerica]